VSQTLTLVGLIVSSKELCVTGAAENYLVDRVAHGKTLEGVAIMGVEVQGGLKGCDAVVTAPRSGLDEGQGIQTTSEAAVLR
jgi:hypothetical protein